MLRSRDAKVCPYCSSNIKEVQFNFDAKLITCNNKQCTFPFQEENFDDYVILLEERIMAKKPTKKLNYQPNRPPLYITESTMASIREDLPDMCLPSSFKFAEPLPKLDFFRTPFQMFEYDEKIDIMDELVTLPNDSSTSQSSSSSSPLDSIYSLVNLL